jgi:carbamoyl-phosphate synthase large subunit
MYSLDSIKKIPILVTGVGGASVGEQLIKALRLAETDYHIHGADTMQSSKGLYEVDTPHIVPLAREAEYLDRIKALCQEQSIQAVFPGSEAELKVLAQAHSWFSEQGILLAVNPLSVLQICLDKYKTVEFLTQNGFLSPTSYTVTSLYAIEHLDNFPYIIKPSIGGGGSANVFVAQTKSELHVYTSFLLDSSRECLVQEYVGTPEEEYTVGVLHDMNGNFINSIGLRRTILGGLNNRIRVSNKTGRAELGQTLAVSSGISQGYIGTYPLVTEVCERIAKALGATGAINIQCRIHQGKVFIFEINPRFSGTTSLRAMVGYNEPDVLVRTHLLGEHIAQRFSFTACHIVRGLAEQIVQ